MDDGGEEIDTGVPASMADLFFALIAVVVLMLLALAPASRSPETLAAGTQAPWRAELTVEGRKPLVLAAGQDGITLAGEAERRVPLASILSDAGLQAALADAAREAQPVLLFVTARGGEAVFLFDALAGRLGVAAVDQVRLDRACTFIAEPRYRRFCDDAGWDDAP